VSLEQGIPVRRFTSRKAQRVATWGSSPGWSAITCCIWISIRP
jgi:hypothetical protein